MSDLETIGKEISELAAKVSIKTPYHLAVFKLCNRYFEAAKAANPKSTAISIQRKLAELWHTSIAWAEQRLALRNLHSDLLPLLDEEGEKRLPMLAAVKLSRHPQEKQKEVFATLLQQVRENKELKASRSLTEAAQCFKEKALEAKPQLVDFSRSGNVVKHSSSSPAFLTAISVVRTVAKVEVAPTPEPEDKELARVRDFFSMDNCRPDPKKTDLPPIPQPKGWDPKQTERVVKGMRVSDE